MLSTIEAVNSVVNNFIWGVPAMICIIGVGLYLSIRTRFLQIRKFPYSMKVTLGRMMKLVPVITRKRCAVVTAVICLVLCAGSIAVNLAIHHLTSLP